MADSELGLHALSYDGAELDAPLSIGLGAAMVTLGRSVANDMCLEDRERMISRNQATIEPLAGNRVLLTNVSSKTPVFVNGNMLAAGAKSEMAPGDRLMVGRYLLELRGELAAAEVSEAPPASLIDSAPAERPVEAAQLEGLDLFASPREDRLAGDQAVGASMLQQFEQDDGGQSLLQGLEDFDATTLADDLHGAQQQVVAGSEPDELDVLKAFSPAPVAEDLGLAIDNAVEIDSLFRLPRDVRAEPPETEPLQNTVATKQAEEQLAKAVPAEMPVQAPEVPANAAGAAPTGGAEPDAAVEAAAPRDARMPLPAADDCRKAFAAACGLPEQAVPEFSPEFAERLGGMLSALVAGTLRMIHGRSLAKHEMRANVTIIATEGNNPLKFAPDGAAALSELLQPRFSGFMEPVEAISNAFDDLSAHQVGLLKGSHEAMYSAVRKLSPERLQGLLGAGSFGERALPALQQGRLWRLFESQYRNMMGDAREEFEAMFEAEFARAYEAEIDRLWTARQS